MLVHRLIIGAAAGGLATIAGLVLILKPGGSERMILAIVLQLIVMGAIGYMIERPRPKQPLTWPMAMLGAVLVAGVSLLAFGQVPHEWITYADAELNWGRRDLIMIDLPGFIPFDIGRLAIRDMIEAGLYTNSFAAACAMWLMWQRRHELAEERAAEKPVEERAAVPAGTSAFGRPKTKQA